MKILPCTWPVSLHCIGIYQVTRTHGCRCPFGYYQFLDMPTDTWLHRNTESRLAIRPIVRWRQSFCWMRSLSRSSCTFPRHQKAPPLQYCCPRYRTVLPAGTGRREQRAGVTGLLYTQRASHLSKAKWFYTVNKCNHLTKFVTVSTLHLCSIWLLATHA